METVRENTAVTNVTSPTDSETKMTDKEFAAELRYLVVILVAKKMLMCQIISREEYRQIDDFMLMKYRPPLSLLLSGKNLLFAESSPEKKVMRKELCSK